MTREEAIHYLSVPSNTNGSGLCTDEQHYEAKQIAIKALEQEPCDDAVSRQAVLDLVADYDLSMGQVVKGIHALLPVTPQPKIEPCNDVVSRQAVLEIQAKYAEHIGATKFWQMRDDIKALPSVRPQPCDDAISREDAEQMFRNARMHLKPEMYKSAEEYNTRDLMLLNAEQMIHALPSVRPQEQTGHWILDEDKSLMFNVYKCSNCENIGARKSKYFPNCGAKMFEPTCDTCEYNTASFMPCNACEDKSEYKPQESEVQNASSD